MHCSIENQGPDKLHDFRLFSCKSDFIHYFDYFFQLDHVRDPSVVKTILLYKNFPSNISPYPFPQLPNSTVYILFFRQIAASDFHLMDMGYIVAGANVLAPLITCIFVQRFGQKRFMLFSAGLMAASLLFLTLLAHFQDGRLIEFIGTSPAFGWTVQTAIVAFLIGHQLGAGCFSWLFCGELCTKKSK